MARAKRTKPKPAVTFDFACAELERVLAGTARNDVIEHALRLHRGDLREALVFLRNALRANRFEHDGGSMSLQRIVRRLDERNQQDGFHVLHDWDGVADRLNAETIPVDVADFLIRGEQTALDPRPVLAILLDYYFLYVIALLTLRVWDDGHCDENLARVSGLVGALQGAGGSGQRFVRDAETLLLVATSHFEPDDQAYVRLLEKARGLGPTRRILLALAHAPILASHLRFGFEATYARDILKMRKDNEPDYPWLSFALATLMERYARLAAEGAHGVERDEVVDALLNGLSPDARAFVGEPPPALAGHEEERSRFLDGMRIHRRALLQEFERHRPAEGRYSPLSFYFNFSHNLLKAMVVDALLRGEPWRLTLNDLLTSAPRDDAPHQARIELVSTLQGYARRSPDRIRGRLVPVIVYDTRRGRRAFTTTLQWLEEAGR